MNKGRISGNRVSISSERECNIVVKSEDSGSRLPGLNPGSATYYLSDVEQVVLCFNFHMYGMGIIIVLTSQGCHNNSNG